MAGMLPKVRQVKVRVPATSANLGSGFDTVGLALDYRDELVFTLNEGDAVDRQGVGNRRDGSQDGGFQDDQSSQASAGVSPDTDATVIIHGEGEETLPRDEKHLVVSTFRRACEAFGLQRFGFMLEAYNNIPQARGMGSSAEAIVAAIAAAYVFAYGSADFNRDTVFQMAAAIEGHPDNVAPAVYGGLTVSWNSETSTDAGTAAVSGPQSLRAGFDTVNYPVSCAITAAVFIPDFELSTEKAREALPGKLPYGDAIFNISRVALLPAAMNPTCGESRLGVHSQLSDDDLEEQSTGATNDQHNASGPVCLFGRDQRDDRHNVSRSSRANRLLFSATQDKVHQPYRKSLMSPAWDLIETLRSQGFAAAVSGAGPCVIVLHYGDAASQIDKIASSQLSSGHWRVLHLPISMQGVQIEVTD
ncbi:homoserine kinase [Bifidobacterium commune]|uniref:Homoserine kinase n=2 Tax=Bifidobacterium commune TaxID=1505727 RepID=A0A1C4H4X4_9BIFI|nr:homoserine kinase [Bifidobacterium commune]SCC80034.1 homoserine kinase [Bifidobacterium commune]